MRINLLCSFDDRHAVKALGARWDATLKTWYVVDPPDLLPFARWLPLDAAQFLATAGGAPQAKAQPTARPKKKRSAPASSRASQPMTNESPTHYTSDWTPQDIPPDEPPW